MLTKPCHTVKTVQKFYSSECGGVPVTLAFGILICIYTDLWERPYMRTSLELLCVFPFIVDECLYNIDKVVKNQSRNAEPMHF